MTEHTPPSDPSRNQQATTAESPVDERASPADASPDQEPSHTDDHGTGARVDHVDDSILELEDVTRSFGADRAVDQLSLTVAEGELLTLLGPSGCGKTTTLRLLAGLERPDEGTIRVRDTNVAGQGRFVPPEERNIGLIFQDFALFPHLTVGENVAYGIQDRPGAAIDRRVEELLELVGLESFRGHPPDALSGGQRQRVALARSLAPEPDVLLLDEPFSNLDVGLRETMREEVRRILKEAGVTAISVTHDQEEALSISDRVGVLRDGHLEQIGPPEAVFQNPTSRFVAEFLGHAGFVSGRVEDGHLETPIGSIPTDRLEGESAGGGGATVDLLVRPDDVRAAAAAAPRATGRIVHRKYTGPYVVYRVELDTGDQVHCQHNHVTQLDVGDPVEVELTADHPLVCFPRE